MYKLTHDANLLWHEPRSALRLRRHHEVIDPGPRSASWIYECNHRLRGCNSSWINSKQVECFRKVRGEQGQHLAASTNWKIYSERGTARIWFWSSITQTSHAALRWNINNILLNLNCFLKLWQRQKRVLRLWVTQKEQSVSVCWKKYLLLTSSYGTPGVIPVLCESLFYFTSTGRKGVVTILCAHIQCLSQQYPSRGEKITKMTTKKRQQKKCGFKLSTFATCRRVAWSLSIYSTDPDSEGSRRRSWTVRAEGGS